MVAGRPPPALVLPWGLVAFGWAVAGVAVSTDGLALPCSFHGVGDPGVLRQHRLRRLVLLHQRDPGNRLARRREQQAQAGRR